MSIAATTKSDTTTICLEIRPGEGGADAADFATTLAEVFLSYARRYKVRAKVATGRTTVITFDSPPPSFDLRRFCGTHRIQRIPSNDTRSRRHTSTATVALLKGPIPEAVVLDDRDLRIDVYRGHGKGGQHRNKTDSAVRLTYLPTGEVVTIERGRSQAQNIATARALMTAKLARTQDSQHKDARNSARVAQFADASRPVKQWTWNTQRSQVVDHTTRTTYPLKDFLRGRLDK
jgi:peptide chain release factor 1